MKDCRVPGAKYLCATRNGGAVILNPEVLAAKGLAEPTCYADLIKPEYKGLISMPNPKSSGTGYMFVKNLVNAWGEDEAFDYFDALAENILQFTTSGSGPVNALVQGEAAIGLGMTAQAVTKINEGANLKIVFFEEGSPYPIDMSLSLANVRQATRMGALRYLKNSLIIAVVVAFLGSALAVFNAYMTARNKTRLSYVLHLMSITSLAIPGIVLGLSYVMFFNSTPIYGTFAMLFLVNSMHFFASPYLMAYNTFGKINQNLEDVGAAMGIGRWGIIRDVLLPQSVGTILEMMSYFFVNCMMTISAVSFLANVSNKAIALMITQFEGQMQLECAAFVSLLILAVNVLMKYAVYITKKKLL